MMHPTTFSPLFQDVCGLHKTASLVLITLIELSLPHFTRISMGSAYK